MQPLGVRLNIALAGTMPGILKKTIEAVPLEQFTSPSAYLTWSCREGYMPRDYA
jgi:hypothetical protein